MKSILAALVLINPLLAMAVSPNSVCQISAYDSINEDSLKLVGVAYLNVKFNEATDDGAGIFKVWDKSESFSFISDEVTIQSKNLKHSYLTGSRYSVRFEHGGTSGSLFDKQDPTNAKFIDCISVE